MTRLTNYATGMFCGMLGLSVAFGGEASTTASAGTGRYGNGTAAATAHYDGADGGIAVTRTRTQTGQVNLARGLAVGLDRDGLDFSFSHAIATPNGPAYAGTFNLSIGREGQVTGSYGGVLAQGGAVRSAEAGGVTRAGGTAQATAHGDTWPTGKVTARTQSYSSPRYVVVPARVTPAKRYWR